MDNIYLINSLRSTKSQDEPRKKYAIEYAYNVSRLDYEFDKFISKLSKSCCNTVFGGEADDFYFTTILATFEQYHKDFDPIAAVILNKTVLQLEFQTRHFISGCGPELFVFDGPKNLFFAAMANVSTTAGVILGDPSLRTFYECLKESTHIEYNYDNIHSCLDSELKGFSESIRRKVGALAISFPNDIDQCNVALHYAALESYVDENTTYLFIGKSETIFEISKQLTYSYPEIEYHTYNYRVDHGAAEEDKRIIFFDGLACLPNIDISFYKDIECRFTTTFANNNPNIKKVNYSETEFLTPAKPKKIVSFVPISNENKLKMSAQIEFNHEVVVIKNGSIVAQKGTVDSTYIHFATNGDIVMDAGNEIARTEMTELYRSGVNVNGVVVSKLREGRRLTIKGPAMPLTFTPDVHAFFSHFMLQCFPRILILRELGLPNAKIIVPYNLRSKQFEMLKIVGISDEQIVKIYPDMIVSAEELIVPRAWPLAMSSFTIRIYDELLNLTMKKKLGTKNILISRESRRTWRNMINYDSVRRILVERYNFEEVKPEKLTIHEEIELFNQANILIGAEGAGMYASCFMQRDSNVVSICDEDYMMPILGTIASLRGFNLHHVFGESFRSARDMGRRLPYGHCDFTVNPLDVADLIEQLM